MPSKRFEEQDSFLSSIRKRRGKELDLQVEKIHQKVFRKIDCQQCANCCKSIPPIVKKADQRTLARHLQISEEQFYSKYLTVDEDGDVVMNSSPCPFLKNDNACSVYEFRPQACRSYPHTDQYQFSRNLSLHRHNTRVCPAVFHIVERLKNSIEPKK